MAVQLTPDHIGSGYPIQLQRLAFPDMRAVPMKRSFAAPECQHSPGKRHHLSHVIVEIIEPSQQTQPTLPAIPAEIQIEQQCDDFAGRIGVNASVPAIAVAAHRQQGGSVAEIYTKFLLDGGAQLRRGQARRKTQKSWPASQILHGKTAVSANLRKVGKDRLKLIVVDEILHDDEIKRVAAQGRCPQPIKIENSQRRLLPRDESQLR
jgi:hypothetical protein